MRQGGRILQLSGPTLSGKPGNQEYTKKNYHQASINEGLRHTLTKNPDPDTAWHFEKGERMDKIRLNRKQK